MKSWQPAKPLYVKMVLIYEFMDLEIKITSTFRFLTDCQAPLIASTVVVHRYKSFVLLWKYVSTGRDKQNVTDIIKEQF